MRRGGGVAGCGMRFLPPDRRWYLAASCWAGRSSLTRFQLTLLDVRTSWE